MTSPAGSEPKAEAMSRDKLAAMNIHEVLRYLPHRYPFLLVDRVLECVPGESLLAIKNVTINEPFFAGHFPVRPVMPGVLLVESMAQATGILAVITSGVEYTERSLYYLVGVDNARFKRPVEPGDQLLLRVRHLRNVRGIWKFAAEALVDDKLVASAEIMALNKDLDA